MNPWCFTCQRLLSTCFIEKPNFRIIENLSNDNSKFVEKQSDLKIKISFIILIQGCGTKDGPDPNKPCVFPFIDRGISHSKCTLGASDLQPWCPTEIDRNGHYIDEKWGNCDSNCETGI